MRFCVQCGTELPRRGPSRGSEARGVPPFTWPSLGPLPMASSSVARGRDPLKRLGYPQRKKIDTPMTPVWELIPRLGLSVPPFEICCSR